MSAKEKRNAMFELGVMFVLETKQEAEDGDPEAMADLGTIISNGTHGFAKDTKMAFHWFAKSADLGNVHGIGNVGMCYLRGHGVGKNVVHGTVLTTRAAENGCWEACYILGVCYLQGRCGFPKDKKEAKHWFTKSVASEHHWKDKELEDDEEE